MVALDDEDPDDAALDPEEDDEESPPDEEDEDVDDEEVDGVVDDEPSDDLDSPAGVVAFALLSTSALLSVR